MKNFINEFRLKTNIKKSIVFSLLITIPLISLFALTQREPKISPPPIPPTLTSEPTEEDITNPFLTSPKYRLLYYHKAYGDSLYSVNQDGSSNHMLYTSKGGGPQSIDRAFYNSVSQNYILQHTNKILMTGGPEFYDAHIYTGIDSYEPASHDVTLNFFPLFYISSHTDPFSLTAFQEKLQDESFASHCAMSCESEYTFYNIGYVDYWTLIPLQITNNTKPNGVFYSHLTPSSDSHFLAYLGNNTLYSYSMETGKTQTIATEVDGVGSFPSSNKFYFVRNNQIFTSHFDGTNSMLLGSSADRIQDVLIDPTESFLYMNSANEILAINLKKSQVKLLHKAEDGANLRMAKGFVDNHILFQEVRASDTSVTLLYLLNTETGIIRTTVEVSLSAHNFCVSPDGAFVSFIDNENDYSSRLAVLDIAKSTIQHLTDGTFLVATGACGHTWIEN